MKKAIGGVLTLSGAIMLIIGVVGLFGTDIAAGNPWVYTILGVIFFIAGISLLRTVKSVEGPVDPRI
jgi:hypothetical protein